MTVGWHTIKSWPRSLIGTTRIQEEETRGGSFMCHDRPSRVRVVVNPKSRGRKLVAYSCDRVIIGTRVFLRVGWRSRQLRLPFGRFGWTRPFLSLFWLNLVGTRRQYTISCSKHWQLSLSLKKKSEFYFQILLTKTSTMYILNKIVIYKYNQCSYK